MKTAIVLCALVSLLGAIPRAAQGQPPSTSYQGELLVDGAPYDGTAAFKFAIVAGGATLWSHDGTSVGGSEPNTAIDLEVTDGIFGVLLGSSATQPLTAGALQGAPGPQLRIWVDTGSGFELLEDQPLASSPYALSADAAQRAIGSFTAQGEVHSVSGGFRFPDGTLQTTAATPDAGAGLDLEITWHQALAADGNTEDARLVVAVNSADGPVAGLTTSDFSVSARVVPGGACSIALVDVNEGPTGVYVLYLEPSSSIPGCTWHDGVYALAVRAATPTHGDVVGVTRLLIDVGP